MHFFLKMIEEGNYGIQDYSIWILRDAEHIVWQKKSSKLAKGVHFYDENTNSGGHFEKGAKNGGHFEISRGPRTFCNI